MIDDHKLLSHPINETAAKTSNENPHRLTRKEADEAVSWMVEMIRAGVIKNTQFKIDTDKE